jgi:hypothetical protein
MVCINEKMIKKRKAKTIRKQSEAKMSRGDLLRWYFDDDKILGLYLGKNKQKYLVYFINSFSKKKVLKYNSIKELSQEWKKV